jgi:hypothetical protein
MNILHLIFGLSLAVAQSQNPQRSVATSLCFVHSPQPNITQIVSAILSRLFADRPLLLISRIKNKKNFQAWEKLIIKQQLEKTGCGRKPAVAVF